MSSRSAIALFLLVFSGLSVSKAAEELSIGKNDFAEKVSSLEKSHGGKLGVAAFNLADRQLLAHRGGERFAMCSTFKLLLASAVAARVEAAELTWQQEIRYGSGDLLEYSPVTGKPSHLEAGKMTISDLCAAAMQYSDNTAANLLLKTLGGPAAVTARLRSLGDATTRLDRIEPDLNTNLENDPRDTSTPEAMLATMENILIGESLTAASRDRLIAWLIGNRTGDKRLRAGIGPGWRVGDKTGTGENGAVNDVAIVWPAGSENRPPFLIAVFYTGSDATPEQRDEVISNVGRIVRETFFP